MEMNSSLYQIFIEEMKEHIELLNACLLQIEKNPADKENINSLFRSVHTMKGSTATAGFHNTAEWMHKFEDLIQAVRDDTIKLDGKVIQLMYVCHDFLENFIEHLLDAGSEEGLKSTHIYEELCLVLGGGFSDRKLQREEVPIYDGIWHIPKMDMEKGFKEAAKGLNLSVMRVQISSQSMFPSITAWMIFEEVRKKCSIISSFPAQPTEEQFKSGAFNLLGDTVYILASSQLKKDEIQSELKSNLLEIEQIDIHEIVMNEKGIYSNGMRYEPKKDCYCISFNKLSIDTDNKECRREAAKDNGSPSDAPVEKKYSPEFIKEIKEHIKNAEIYYLELKYNPDNLSEMDKLYHCFHTVNGLAGYIEHELIYNLSKVTENLLDMCKKRKVVVDDFTLELILNSIIYINDLCDYNFDDNVLQEMEAHHQFLKNSLIVYVKKVQSNIKIEHSEMQTEKKIGEILIDKGKIDKDTLDEVISLQRNNYRGLKFGQVLVKEGKVDIKDVAAALTLQEKSKIEGKSISSIRISEQKLDSLLDMLGELIIVQSLHKENISNLLDNNKVDKNMVQNSFMRMERITKDIHHISLSMRMISLKQSFQKLLRIGRDTSKELGKDVNIDVYGDETEIDRSVVEKIQDPLMHLLRNAIYHGIEKEEERKAKGKSPIGTVSIKAYNKKGSVYIEISDDGKGLHTEEIYRKAQEKDLIEKNKNYSEEEIINLIFLPGLSTVENVNNISGRGVGMNVVESEIKKIGGKVEIKNSQGKGCTFVLKIPVNLATINGTIVDMFSERYIIPTVSIKHIFKPAGDQWVSIKDNLEMVRLRNDLIPLIHLNSFMDISPDADMYKECVLVVVEHEQKYRALPVRTVIGKQEVVIKPVGNEFNHLKFLSGATILGDGKVSLILDIETLFKENLEQ